MKKIKLLLVLCAILTSDFSMGQTGAKTTIATYPEAWVMIPAGGHTRLGYYHHYPIVNEITSELFPVGLASIPSIVDLLGTNRINNTLGIGGLPTTFPGPNSLLGLSKCQSFYSSPTNGYKFYISATLNVSGATNHYLIRVFKPPLATDFEVEYVSIVSSSFAPASAGWRLGHIESNGAIMWGLFFRGSESHLASFPIPATSGSTTAATSSAYWSWMRMSAMDISAGNIRLMEFTTSTIIDGVISGSTVTLAPPASFTLPPATSSIAHHSFVVYGAGYGLDFHGDHLSIFEYPATPVTSTRYAFPSGWASTPTTSGLGFIINDAALQR